MKRLAQRVSGYSEIKRDEYCYYKSPDGVFYLWIPSVGLGNLASHEVTEHQDGTITVAPSILVTSYNGANKVEAHGYLEAGYWRDC